MRSSKLVPVVQTELIDSIHIVAEQADDPLVRPDILLFVLKGTVVADQGVLPFVCFLEGALKSDHLIAVSLVLRTENVLDLALPNVLEKLLLQRSVLALFVQDNLVFAGLMRVVKADVAKVVLKVKFVLKELFDVLHGLVTIHDAVIARIHDQDNRLAENVVMTQPLVDGLTVAPAHSLSVVGGRVSIGRLPSIHVHVRILSFEVSLLTNDELDAL